jgi:DHA2 family multidrug resistance protein-like MFS transporter
MFLPEFRDPDAGRLDLLSAGLSLVGVLAVIYGIKQSAENGLGGQSLLSVLIGLAIFAVFLLRQRTLTDPLIDLRLFRVPAFSASLATNTLGVFAAFGSFFFTAQYLQLVEGLSPIQAGLWSLPSSGAFILGSVLATMIVRKVRPAFVISAGLVIGALGFGVLTQVDATSGLATLVTGTFINSIGLALVFTLTIDLIVGTAPPARAGAASAISETGSELGGALGIAILGSVGAAVYRSEIGDRIPAGVSPEAAGASRDTLGGAVAVADLLPDPLGAELLVVSRDAFVQGLQATAAIGAAVMFGTAIMVAIVLRNARGSSEAEEHPDLEPEEALAGSIRVKTVLDTPVMAPETP